MPGNSGSDIITGLPSETSTLSRRPAPYPDRQSKRTTHHPGPAKALRLKTTLALISSSPTLAHPTPPLPTREQVRATQGGHGVGALRTFYQILSSQRSGSSQRREKGNTIPRAIARDQSSTCRRPQGDGPVEATRGEMTMHQHVRWRTPSAFRSCARTARCRARVMKSQVSD